jgi:hypothetical protein
MSGECDKCGEHCTDCRCNDKIKTPMVNYFQMVPGMTEEVKVWAQMFFNDGSVTQGQYIPRCIFDDIGCIEGLARDFLEDTNRKEGVLFIWGAGRVFAKRAELFLARRGAFKGRETLRLRNL